MGDVVIKVNDKPVTSPRSFAASARSVSGEAVGTPTSTVALLRDGTELQVKVRLPLLLPSSQASPPAQHVVKPHHIGPSSADIGATRPAEQEDTCRNASGPSLCTLRCQRCAQLAARWLSW